MMRCLQLSLIFVLCRGAYHSGEPTDTLSGWTSSGCVSISYDAGDYACGPLDKCIVAGGVCPEYHSNYIHRTWTVPIGYAKWMIKFSVGSSTFKYPGGISVQYACGNMTNYCTLFQTSTACNRKWGCLNMRYNLPLRCDHVDSISIRVNVSHDDANDKGYIKYITFYYNVSDGQSITESCYLDSTTGTPTTGTPTAIISTASPSVAKPADNTKSTNINHSTTSNFSSTEPTVISSDSSPDSGNGTSYYFVQIRFSLTVSCVISIFMQML